MRRWTLRVTDFRPDRVRSSRPWWRAASILLLLLGIGHGAAGAGGDQAERLRGTQALDARVATVGYRLATSAGDLCPGEYLPGFAVHDASQYGGADKAAARTTFGFGDTPSILAVAEDSPAARAGMRADDRLIAIEGKPPPASPKTGAATFAVVSATVDMLEKASADGRLDLALQRGGKPFTVHLALQRGCGSRFTTRPSDQYDARADGRYVEVTTAAILYAESADTLAAILGHELAHNILRHRVRLNTAGVSRGLLGGLGRSGRLSRQAEIEADRLGVHLSARAGYDIDGIAEFWRRRAANRGLRLSIGDTHPSDAKRIAVIEEEVAAIRRARAEGRQDRPAFMAGGTLPPFK